jgi:hypothetical protein
MLCLADESGILNATANVQTSRLLAVEPNYIANVA